MGQVSFCCNIIKQQLIIEKFLGSAGIELWSHKKSDGNADQSPTGHFLIIWISLNI